jgi:pimeloyl-ACP methyl ester carboxylesterase
MEHVISKDGTPIAYERLGTGPALVLVDGALCSRAFGPMPKLAPLFAKHFTVFTYDRRGRGASGDTQPYAKAREIEDLAAVIQAAGGAAAAAGVGVTRLVAYEPPYVAVDGRAPVDHRAALERLVAAGKRGAALRYFMADMVGMPRVVAWLMRLMPMWSKLEAVAHTLPYDAAVMGAWSVPTQTAAAVKVPTLAMSGAKSPAVLREAARRLAAAVPGGVHRELAGQTHNVSPEALVPAVVAFYIEESGR